MKLAKSRDENDT